MLKEVTVGSMVKPCSADEDLPTLDKLQRFCKCKGNKGNKDNEYDDDDNDDADENEGSKMAASLLDELLEL